MKSEYRMPKSEGNSNPEIRRIAIRSGAVACQSHANRYSDFGLLSGFEFRYSNFLNSYV